MSEGFHVHGPHDHELEHAAHGGDDFSSRIAVSTAIMATVGALFGFQGGDTQNQAAMYKNNAAIKKTEASNQWNYYQAKSNKQNLSELAITLPGSDTAKYTAGGGATLEVPAQIPDAASARLVELATLAFRTLYCEGLARVDFFLGADGTITLNEVNTLPGLTAFSQYPRIWQAVGVSCTELLSRLIDRAVIAFSGEQSVVATSASAPGVAALAGST